MAKRKERKTNRADEGLLAPLKLPAPLAAAGVRGELKDDMPDNIQGRRGCLVAAYQLPASFG